MVQKELLTALITGIIGFVAAFFITNLFVGDTGKVTIPTTDSSVSTELSDPDPEIFNFKSLNPTVEVYVGQNQEEE